MKFLINLGLGMLLAGTFFLISALSAHSAEACMSESCKLKQALTELVDAQKQQALRLCKNSTCRIAIQNGALSARSFIACHKVASWQKMNMQLVPAFTQTWTDCEQGMGAFAKIMNVSVPSLEDDDDLPSSFVLR